MTARTSPPVTARPPGRSPLRLLVTFVVALGVVLLVVGAVAVALAPKPPPADCPDPNQVCGGPPIEPTLPPASQVAGQPPATLAPGPVATATSAPSAAPTGAPATASAVATAPPASAAPATPAPTVPPAATPVAPSPSSAPPTQAPVSPAPTAAPTPPPATLPPATPEPTAPVGFVVPAPRAASDAAPFRAGTLWRSEQFGFGFEYDPDIWTIREQGPEFVYMLAARGNVALTVGAYPADQKSAQQAFADERARLEGQILGLTEEPDPRLQLPGLPNIGYQLGLGGVFAGTINSPQGPTINVSVVLLTASHEDMTILVTVLTVNQLRPAAFSIVDSMLNTLRWSETTS